MYVNVTRAPSGSGLGALPLMTRVMRPGGRVPRVMLPPPAFLRRGLRGLGLTCEAGYHDYTPDGVNHICQPDVYTVARQLENQTIAAEIAANPLSVQAQYAAAYGYLPQDVQAKLLGCKLAQDNAQRLGTSIPSECVGSDATLIARFMPSASTAAINQPGIVMTAQGPVAVALPGALPGAAAAPAAPPSVPLTVTLKNLSGGAATSFKVGDTFELTVTGPPGKPVIGTASQNGGPASATPFGSTDSGGKKVLTGSMTPDTVGTWAETWTVGGQNAGSLSFTVVAAPSGGGGGGAPPPGGGGGTTEQKPANGGTTAFDFSFLSNPVNLLGVSVPVWGLALAAGVGLYAFSGKRGR